MHKSIFGLSEGCEFVALRWHSFIVALTLMASIVVSGCGEQQSIRATWAEPRWTIMSPTVFCL